jgi:hypothetical protein
MPEQQEPKVELGVTLFDQATKLKTAHKFGGAYKIKHATNGLGQAMVPLSSNDKDQLALAYPGLTGLDLKKAQDGDKQLMAGEAIDFLAEMRRLGVEWSCARWAVSRNKVDGRVKVALTVEESKYQAKESIAKIALALGQTTEFVTAKLLELERKQAASINVQATVTPELSAEEKAKAAEIAKAIEDEAKAKADAESAEAAKKKGKK